MEKFEGSHLRLRPERPREGITNLQNDKEFLSYTTTLRKIIKNRLSFRDFIGVV